MSLKEVLEDVGRAKDAHERFGAWCGALGMIGLGAFFYFAPEEIREEVEWHREAGLAMAVFGFVFTLALALKGSAGYRARALLFALIAAGVGGALVYTGLPKWRQDWELYQRGEVVQARVDRSGMSFAGERAREKTVLQIGNRYATVYLGMGSLRVGDVVDVLVLPEEPDSAVPAYLEGDLRGLVEHRQGLWGALALLGVVLFCALALPYNLWAFLVGPPRGVDPDALV